MTRPTGALIYRPFDAPLYYAPVMDPTSPECIMLEYIQAELEDIFTANMARRDADAARNGEPRDAYEFYHGREKSK